VETHVGNLCSDWRFGKTTAIHENGKYIYGHDGGTDPLAETESQAVGEELEGGPLIAGAVVLIPLETATKGQ
jgi:hypothetical protein